MYVRISISVFQRATRGNAIVSRFAPASGEIRIGIRPPLTPTRRECAMAKKKTGMCAYCGTMGEITRDHVIPKNLFAGNVPGDIPKVGACPACNNPAKSDDDRYLQHMLVMDSASSKQPTPQQLFADKFVRTVPGNTSQ